MEDRNIEMVDINKIGDHPEQAMIYGVEPVDADLVDSIKRHGVLQPLLLTFPECLNFDEDYKDYPYDYIAVAGHRRLKAAIAAGLTQVPAETKYYDDPDDCEAELIASNKNREKNILQRIREFLSYKQILSQKLQGKDISDVYADSKSEYEVLSRFLENVRLNKDDLRNANSIDILKDVTGFSKYYQELITVVFDDEYRTKRMKKLSQMGLSGETEHSEIWYRWNEAREQVENGAASAAEGAAAIKEMLARIEKALLPKKKKAKKKPEPPHSKKPVQLSFEFDELFDEDYFDDELDYDVLYETEDAAAGVAVQDGVKQPYIKIGNRTLGVKWEKLIEFAETA